MGSDFRNGFCSCGTIRLCSPYPAWMDGTYPLFCLAGLRHTTRCQTPHCLAPLSGSCPGGHGYSRVYHPPSCWQRNYWLDHHRVDEKTDGQLPHGYAGRKSSAICATCKDCRRSLPKSAKILSKSSCIVRERAPSWLTGINSSETVFKSLQYDLYSRDFPVRRTKQFRTWHRA